MTAPMTTSFIRENEAGGPLAILATMDNCTKCGICQTYCPVAAVTSEFPGPKVVGPQAQRFRAIEAIAESAIGLCSGCGVCTSVCPNGVAITDIIAIAKAASVENGNKPALGLRLLNRPDLVGHLAGSLPWLANSLFASRPLRRLAEKVLGISADAALPHIEGGAFRRWFSQQEQPNGPAIAYFTGCTVENYEANVGKSVVLLLNHLGFRVELPTDLCCGLPLLSNGEWPPARERAQHLTKALAPSARTAQAIVSSSTSCSLTLRKKYAAYLDMKDGESSEVATATIDICGFLRDLPAEPLESRLKSMRHTALYHGPCQLRGHQMGWPAVELLSLIPGLQLQLSSAVCCGTAGTYGFDRDKRAVTDAVAVTLLDQIRVSKPDFIICDSETCRWHIAAESGLPCFHPVEILLASIEGRGPLAD
ncbi:anaerobic glycerol-3-phosphate dehydrogenase subunit C [Hypericibacter sp.]|uniref:anaerobic glycerol-3-phosphate dehydrogenase subunit C n=1 Tax=Hypericibacter sp. TaxID=2705401 RepID=UPI003D6D78EE